MKKLLLFLFLFAFFFSSAQMDCTLGVGGRDDDTIIEVFQLNEEQTEYLKNWSEELKVRNTYLKDKAKVLLKKHEASPPSVLMEMSYEYRQLLDSMRSNARMIDRRLLATFNQKQYDLYVELCGMISMSPMRVDNSVNEK
ncbi:MAG: hypothetical protein AAGC43_13830 [Bacteroidota bacterium]